ncbi:non-ribosomal peptide synthetase [Nodularia sphaerocarpa]|uniref:non-ribosomal peptide synthetase n=1 Tax=Nodularia sphaerocarpa TaxID=137816 RepID=UPI001EFB5E19|nr:non-ribosomal peptide synthetase [Nodularia sphaerocarpa]MDB9373597.1 amino acid adenylation domain-containing protein [Nodularia sphaerocarpa CS-585]MDB9379808.1 amino acid adenylation domain-containing protein [Nodularia sphaerocarpa CS-585A2]ULP74384.1 non-ribosomal peptide synthetase [Nodularia sphaerocarpa UHCC 0038]
MTKQDFLPQISQQKIIITATFTSEPIEDYLSYWLEEIEVPYSIEFAPYNQVFQELLNPTSVIANNLNGVNVVLLRWEDWEGTKNRLQLTVDDDLKAEVLGDRLRHILPNHLEVAHLNQYETEYLYQEIFVDRVYLKHGIVFNEDDCIIDVGANIGLFTLFAQQKSPKGTIYAFEPAPHAFDKLQTNAKLYCQNTHLFNCGLGGEARSETFTFYPRSSVFSSFAADTEQDEKAIRSVIMNMLQRDNSLDEESLESLADEFIKDRLERETYQAQLRTLSEIIEEYNLQKIDLLKLDAEKSELAILQGIKDNHWLLIKQIVMEVHDQEGSTLKQVLGLLEDKGFKFVVDEESLLHGSGLFNIYATRVNQNHNPVAQEFGKNTAQIEQTVKDFGSALKTAIMRSPNPYFVCICPSSPTNDTATNTLYERMAELLAADLKNVSGMYLIKSQELTSIYPVEQYYDAYGDELGHIPYTPAFFCALATMLARKIFALKSSPYKVVVLDCDNTLWSGICGEDGVAGVKITLADRALQEFIVSQQAAGKLICLCSKNQEEDVFAVFDQHQDMVLKRHHLVNWRINWESKSANLKSLAAELQLSLDSFIFIDDNPLECAEVKANCPEVLTLKLPEKPNTQSDHLTQFLAHIWAFDQLQTTQEDEQRTDLYQQNVQRQRLQEDSLSFTDFLAQLNLEIEISPMESEELARVAQLTQRTNQFNLTTIRRSEAEIAQLCNLGKLESHVVKVKDRFGDYGLVGLLLFSSQENALFVDTFLLSCRVLGRGVEHKMLAYLGTLAQERGLGRIEVFYTPTKKNQPARDFLTSVGRQFQQEKDRGWLFEFPSEIASASNFRLLSDLDNKIDGSLVETASSDIDIVDKKADGGLGKTAASADFFERIALNLYSPELILKEITSRQKRQRPQLDIEFVAPRTSIEKAIAHLFAEVLKLDRVGINDNFFELGGDSIRGAILINKLQAQLNEIIHFVILFDTKTVKGLGAYIEKNYPQATAKLLGQEINSIIDSPQERIDEAKVLQMRSLIPPLVPPIEDDAIKNPPAIFILSPHRSGSTLLRVILGGNPQLFAPPELELLTFNTLGERKAAFSGRYSFWTEGTIRTIMQIRGCSAEEAIALMAELEAKNLTTKQFYQLIQQWLGDKILVDKTPSYSIDLETLKQAERNFQNPLYIHLVRHPYATMRSYEEARVEQTFPYQHPFNRRELAELVWLISHENILEFLKQVPQERQYQVKFEDIVSQPQTSVEGLCQFLGLDFHPDMLQPYKEKKQRMTDGIYAQSRMVGDVKFHEHQGINPSTADTWKQYYSTDFLGDVTWRVAESLGYPKNNNAIPQVRRGNHPESQTFPLSFAQQRLWVLAQLEPDSPFYNMFKAVRLNGRIDIEILERSFNEIISRHEVLRTTFSAVDGTPIQVIAPHASIKLSVVDLQKVSGQEQSEQLQLLATQDQLQPFDLSKGLLLRVTLVQLQPESSALLLTMHHIIADGWSMGVLIQELSSLYRGFLVAEPSPLPDLPIQYADFTIWQRQWLQEGGLQTQINYWTQQLADAPPLLELPTDRPRPSVQTFRGWCFSFQLDAKLTAALKELSRKSGTTLFMTLMAAYATLLCRYSGQSDILLGTPNASRNRQDIEGLIGFFVNTLVMRTRLEGNPSFSELLMQVRSVCMDAYANQDVPFEQIVEALQIERSLSHSPLFQVMFALQNAPMEQVETPDLGIAPLHLDNVNAKFDLTLQMWETNTEQGNSLEGFWQYNTDLFDADRIARMTGHFQTLLAGIVANPQASVGTLPLLTERERHQLLVEWNDTYIPYPDSKCIHQVFEEQVEQTPDAIAVVYDHESLTYRDLNQRANQLAHYLQTLGVRTEVLVGICVERSLEMIIGMLAILKAGGAYVPLDSSYPQERLAYMLNDSQVSILLTQEQLGAQIPETNAQFVYLDSDWQETISKYTQQNLSSQASSHNLAYVIYTSGSTGKPKGITVTHQAVNRLVCNTNYVNLTANHRVAQASNAAFDAATFEIWGALLNGARLVGITKEVLLSPPQLATQLQEQQIDFLFVTTALFNQLVSQVPGIFKTLQTVLFGGEAVEPNWVRTLLQNQPPKRLLHVYGPTENTTFSSWYLVQQVPEGATNLAIGQPIANTQIYILDRHLQPVPIGVPGELCIGGDGLARGYLNRPELTEEKFIANSIAEAQLTSSKKLYKTGDLARYLPDGNIEFIGRIDNQVKIRGFRIELAEIEVVLTQHPQVGDAIVIAREDKPSINSLAAYVVSEGKPPKSSELRSFLKEKLPEYMLPASFTVLEAFPVTPNGKVDRRALPVPELEFNDSTGLVSPRTDTEKKLVKIWRDVLLLKQVCIHDNFFELGGDSIIGIQIVARANQAGLKLTPKQLFQHQTIAELAAVAVTTTSKEAEQGLVKGIVPLTPIQHWFFEQNLPEPHHFNQSVLLEVPSNIQGELLEQALQKLLSHHDALRLRFVPQAEQWQQYNSDVCEDRVLLAEADLSHLAQTEQSKAIELKADEIQRSLNLADGPILRSVLYNCGNSYPGRLLIVIHHLAVDGISWRILLEDLSQAYKQLNSGNNIQLPAKTTSFKDWAIRLQDYAGGEQLHSELDYWLQLKSFAVAPLPLDSLAIASENTVGSSRIVSLSLSEEQTRSLLQDVPGAYNTQINDVLLTALVQSFAGWTGHDSLLISLEGHGREDLFEDVDLSRTAGWFTSLFPVCLQVAGLHHPGEALKSVKEQLRRIPNRGIGYGILRYLSQDAAIHKQLELLPQPQVSFNYLGQFDQTHLAPLGWKYAPESSGSIHSPQGQRRHLLNVNGLVIEGRLQLEWKYSQAFHHQSTIENLAQNYVKTLEAIIDHCLSPEAFGYTPSDFPEVGLSQEELDELLTEIE